MQPSIESILADFAHAHVWVLEYGISHGRRMVLALHHGDYPRGVRLEASGCSRFSGDLETGPCDLELLRRPRDSLQGKRSPVELVLRDKHARMELVCEELRLLARV